MLKIGDIAIDNRSVLAPLAGISDLPFRAVNRRFGCELAFIEMTSVHALGFRNKKTMKTLETEPGDIPLGLQLLGRDHDTVLRALDTLEGLHFDVLDLNAACPVKKVVRRGEGAALMKEPEVLGGILKLLAGRSSVPVTVKIRAGWDPSSINAAEVARVAEGSGAVAVFIHGRTRVQGYGGTVDYSAIRSAKEAVGIPVIASGDIFSAELAKRMMDETGADGVVMARGALGNPWIFKETAEYLRSGTIPRRPDIDEITNVMLWHLDKCAGFYGEEHSVRLFRKFFVWYTKGLHNVRPLRMRAVRALSIRDMKNIIAELREADLSGRGQAPPTRLPFHTDV